MDKKIFVITETQYTKTNWYIRVMNGLNQEALKKTYKIVFCTEADLGKFEAGTIIVLIGSSQPFISKYIHLCMKHALRPLVAGPGFQQTTLPVSHISINRYAAMSDMVDTLVSFGAKSIAFLGVNRSYPTDMQRLEAWKASVSFHRTANPQKDIYFSDDSFENCMDSFWENVHRYDAVVCTNDYYAVYVCSHASQYGISIPDDLMVTGFGNTLLGQYTTPPLTTVSLNLSSVGRQIVTLHRLLSQNSDIHSCSESMKANIILRGTTKNFEENRISSTQAAITPNEFFTEFSPADGPYLKRLYALENTIGKLDETDYKLIRGILKNIPYQALAEELFLSDTAFKYRLQKLLAGTDCKNRNELIQLIRQYIPQLGSSCYM